MEKNIQEVTLTKYAAKAGVIKFGTWGSRGIEQLHITALPPWDEAAVITVTFVNGRVQSEPQVFPESMTIDVPQAATSAATKSRASCKMVFKGIDQSGAVVYSTDLPYTVLNRTDIDGAEYDPGKNAFEQYIQQVGAYRDTALNAANSARNSELSAEEYADSAKAADSAARKSAESAAASAAGIAESEKRAAASAASAAGSAASAEETRKQVERIAAGVAKGNMSVSDYDNDGAVKAAGGMKAYTKAQTDVLAADIKKANDSIAEVKTTAGAAAAQAEKNKTDLAETNNTLANVQTNFSSLAADVGNLQYPNAGAHNAIYRGKFLGNTVTAAQYAAIKAGTFDDLYIGDYWTIGDVNYRIAAFDYFLNVGDKACTDHHVVLVPDTRLYNAQMHNTSSGGYEDGAANTTAGGYVGSDMYKSNLEQAKTIIKRAFSGHVLNHRVYLVNAVANGAPSAGALADSEVDLMTERMVYGSPVFSPMNDGQKSPWSNMHNYTVEKSQLPLFQHDPSRICNRESWWLRDVASASSFTNIFCEGFADYGDASYSHGVRPYFCIY